LNEERRSTTTEPIGVALLLGDTDLLRSLTAAFEDCADFAGVAAVETADVVITDRADGDAVVNDGTIVIHARPFAAGPLMVRAILPEGLDPRHVVEAARLVAAGLMVLPRGEPEEAGLADTDEVSGARSLTSNLTRREREVLELLAAGASNKEIARRLEISIHTVKFHMASLFAKLGAASRLEAVGIGLRNGLIMM
jgi:DNA-binding CsgD family transcriptional regulator